MPPPHSNDAARYSPTHQPAATPASTLSASHDTKLTTDETRLAIAGAHLRACSNGLAGDLAAQGFVTRTSWLHSRGHSRSTITRALSSGTILRLCSGWVATGEANQLSVLAVQNYAQLIGPTALQSQRLWDAADTRLHIRVPPNSHGAARNLAIPVTEFVAPRVMPTGLVRHWMPVAHSDPREPLWRASVIDSLALVGKISPSEQFIASTESALNNGAFSRAGLPVLASLLPHRARGLLRLVNAASESGLESLTRLRLTPHVGRIDTQVPIPGIARSGRLGFVDLLIDGWLAIEVDGDEFHDEGADRRRNASLVRQGYRWHRFGYDQIMFRWPEVLATVLELLRYPPR